MLQPLLLLLLTQPLSYATAPPSALIEGVAASLQEVTTNDCFSAVLRHSLGGAGCEKINEEQKSEIALAFTNCHYERHGREALPCRDGGASCTRLLSSEQWGAFTLFLSHVDSLCFYHKALDWESEQRQLASLLINHALAASDRLTAIADTADDLVEAQRLINF